MVTTAPLATRQRAPGQLTEAIPVLERLFASFLKAHAALAVFDHPFDAAAVGLVLDGSNQAPEDRWNYDRLLGVSHMRMVPWETPF